MTRSDDCATTTTAFAATAPPDLHALLTLASDLARAAGQVHLAGRRTALVVETKSSATDMVSQVDKEAERVIVEGLRRARPNDALLAEEGSGHSGGSNVRWVVDPLDGTTNYVYGYPAHTVSIAAEVDGETAVGVVYDSSADKLYRAVIGHGAVCDDRPLHARQSDDLAAALLATGFSYDSAQRTRQGAVIAAVLGHIRDLRRGGAASLDLCRLAAGELDGYWELDLSPWDYAAGALIAREAGAAVNFVRAAHGRGPAIVAASPALLPRLCALLTAAGALLPD